MDKLNSFIFRNGFVKCTISGTVIAKKADDIKRYLEGKSFKQAVQKGE